MNVMLFISFSFLCCNVPKTNNEDVVNLGDSTNFAKQEILEYNLNLEAQGIEIGYNNLKLIGKLNKKIKSESSKEIVTTG